MSAVIRLIQDGGVEKVVDALIYHLEKGKWTWDYQKYPSPRSLDWKGERSNKHIVLMNVPKTNETISIALNKMGKNLPQISVRLERSKTEKPIWKRIKLRDEDFKQIEELPIVRIQGGTLFFSVFPQVKMTPELGEKLVILKQLMLNQPVIAKRGRVPSLAPKKERAIIPLAAPKKQIRKVSPPTTDLTYLKFQIENKLRTNGPSKRIAQDIKKIVGNKIPTNELLDFVAKIGKDIPGINDVLSHLPAPKKK